MKEFRLLVAATMLLGMLTGCGGKGNKPAVSEPSTAAPARPAEKKEPALYTGKQCFTRMTDMAQRWAPDALPFHLESNFNAEATGQGGKSAVWRAWFTSLSRGTFKTFICSGSRLPDEPVFGVTSTAELTAAPNTAALVFQPFYLQADSDQAFAVAQKHGGANLTKKDPKQTVIYLLDKDPKQNVVAWYVLYGETQASAKGIGVINATNGNFLRASK